MCYFGASELNKDDEADAILESITRYDLSPKVVKYVPPVELSKFAYRLSELSTHIDIVDIANFVYMSAFYMLGVIEDNYILNGAPFDPTDVNVILNLLRGTMYENYDLILYNTIVYYDLLVYVMNGLNTRISDRERFKRTILARINDSIIVLSTKWIIGAFNTIDKLFTNNVQFNREFKQSILVQSIFEAIHILNFKLGDDVLQLADDMHINIDDDTIAYYNNNKRKNSISDI